MLNHAIWLVCIALEVFVLARGFRAQLWARYHFFFAYLAFVLFEDIVSLFFFRFDNPNSLTYRYIYWSTEFICVLLGCGVVFEVYRVTLARFPGTARMARNVLTLVFMLAVAKGIANAWDSGMWWLEGNTRAIEQMVRTVEFAAILAIVCVFLLYSIPVSRNLRGILIGYGSFVGIRVLSLPFVPRQGQDFWSYIYSGCYLVALSVWLVMLWSYSESPSPDRMVDQLEIDYQRAVAATRRRLEAARGQLAKAARS